MIPGNVYYEGYSLELAKKSVGPGWHGILETLFSLLSQDTKVVQVKQKMGFLCVYADLSTAMFDTAIRAATQTSRVTCERCGAVGTLHSNFEPGKAHWIRTLCDACEIAYQKGEFEAWL